MYSETYVAWKSVQNSRCTKNKRSECFSMEQLTCRFQWSTMCPYHFLI